MKFLAYDSQFMSFARKLMDYILLGLLWVAASIPVLTIGASTVAMFYTAEKSIREDGGKIFSTFWNCFRKDFMQATGLWLIAFALTAFLATSCYFSFFIEMPGIMKLALAATAAVCAGWMQLWFGYLSKFEDSTWLLLKNTFVITLMNIPRVALLVIIAAAAVAGEAALFLTVNLAYMFFIPGIYAMLAGNVLRKIFQKYIPEERQEAKAELPCD